MKARVSWQRLTNRPTFNKPGPQIDYIIGTFPAFLSRCDESEIICFVSIMSISGGYQSVEDICLPTWQN